MEAAQPAARIIDGRYRLMTPLGEGGMGAVYEAEHVFTGRRVAVKLLLPQAATDADLVRRFLEEARSAARVAHPYCVDILDMGEEPDGTLYLVQELLTGMDLRRYLRQVGRLSPSQALDIAIPIIEALGAAHDQGVVHRDVKPSNIFLVRGAGGTWVPKLIDFGTAKMIEFGVEAQHHTRTGRTIGTPTHMAPEQLRGERDLDGRTDVWAMGVVLYEMLAGSRPYVASNPHLLAVQILTQRPPRLETRVPEVSPALAEVIHRALEPDRGARLGSMGEFRAALMDCGRSWGYEPGMSARMEPAPWPETELSPVSAASTPAATMEVEASDVLTAESPVSLGVPPVEPRVEENGRRGWKLGLALLVVTLLAGAGLLWRGHRQEKKGAAVRVTPAVPEPRRVVPTGTSEASPMVASPPVTAPWRPPLAKPSLAVPARPAVAARATRGLRAPGQQAPAAPALRDVSSGPEPAARKAESFVEPDRQGANGALIIE